MTFVGFVEHVARELALLDIPVHASVVLEPFGQIVVEGMAAGLAVIASAAGGPLEIITPELDGLGQAAVVRAHNFGPGPIGERI